MIIKTTKQIIEEHNSLINVPLQGKAKSDFNKDICKRVYLREWICLDDLKYLIKERRNLYWNKCNENHGNEMCSCADIIFELNKIEDLCSSEQKEGVEKR